MVNIDVGRWWLKLLVVVQLVVIVALIMPRAPPERGILDAGHPHVVRSSGSNSSCDEDWHWPGWPVSSSTFGTTGWERWANPNGQNMFWPAYCEHNVTCMNHGKVMNATFDTVGRGLCLFTVVDDNERYMGFVPLYAYFALAAYPEARVVVVTGNGFPEYVHTSVRAATATLGLNDTSVRLVVDPSTKPATPKVGKSSVVAAMRFLYDDPTGALQDCDFVYTGDVDILIEREEPSLLAFHAHRMLVSGQPFDNARRMFEKNNRLGCHGFHGERLTGLHMVLYGIYRNRTEQARRELLAAVQSGEVASWCCTRSDFCDEHILFQLVWRSGLNPGYVRPEPMVQLHHKRIRPVHGIHYSQIGRQGKLDTEERRRYWCPLVRSSLQLFRRLPEHPRQMLHVLDSTNCQQSNSTFAQQ